MVRTLTQCLQDRPHRPCLHADRRARRRQDDHRPHPRARAQLRDRPAVPTMPTRRCRAGRHCRAIMEAAMSTCSRWTPPPTPASTTCARSSTGCAMRPVLGALQGLHHRRSAHAVDGGLQRAAEDAGRAAAACEVHLRHDRDPQGAGHHPVALPALRPAPHRGRPPVRAFPPHRRRKGVTNRGRGAALIARAADGSVRDGLSCSTRRSRMATGRSRRPGSATCWASPTADAGLADPAQGPWTWTGNGLVCRPVARDSRGSDTCRAGGGVTKGEHALTDAPQRSRCGGGARARFPGATDRGDARRRIAEHSTNSCRRRSTPTKTAFPTSEDELDRTGKPVCMKICWA
jgi:hypothetical protein